MMYIRCPLTRCCALANQLTGTTGLCRGESGLVQHAIDLHTGQDVAIKRAFLDHVTWSLEPVHGCLTLTLVRIARRLLIAIE